MRFSTHAGLPGRALYWMAALIMGLALSLGQQAQAQTTVGTLDLSNVGVDGAQDTVLTTTLPGGTVDSISLSFTIQHFGISYGSETYIIIQAPSGDSITINNSTFGFRSGPGTFTFNGSVPFPPNPSAGTWTVRLGDSFNDSGIDHRYSAGSTLDFVGISNDTTPPEATIASTESSPTSTAPIPVTVSFTEDVTDFDAGDLDISGGTATNFTGSGSAYSFDLVPTQDGTLTVDIAAGAAQDAAGNASLAAPQFSIVHDCTCPTVTLSSPSPIPTNVSPIPMIATFSEPVVGFNDVNVVVTNGSVSAFSGSGAVYTFDVIPDAEGTVLVDVPRDVAEDLAGNENIAAQQFSIHYDATGPGLTITGVPDTVLPGDEVKVFFTFGEDVTGFDATDITVTGATAGPLTGGPDVYTMTLIADGTGNLTVTVPDGAAQDAALNPSTGATATAELDSAGIAGEMIAAFMETRARNLIANQPGLTRFLNGQEGGQFSASVTRGFGDIDIHTGAGPVWFSLSGSATEFDGGGDSAYALATLGAHVAVTDGLLIGGMLQFDHAEDDMGGGLETRGTGWLIGPYVVAQLGAQPLFFEGRLLYGESDNEVSPFGTFTDDFDTERWLTLIALEGAYETEHLRYFPRLQISHAVDTQLAYVDSLANLVPEQTVRLSEVSAGVDFEAPLLGDDSGHLLTWGMSGIWSRVEGDGAASAFIDETEGGRGRVDLGYRYAGNGLWSLSSDVFVDGIGSGDFTTYGVALGFDMRF
ncbi:hypothetical protein roselon_02395 [Roseibacterium elongatum DSM 19469]|uniref:Autotransporter domain-containing protein n=1 Tax=Roseicyclus elongatus DSM 19469 TaxID=1294273 RepID=W8S3D2_9RHOB|nr:Ig-like domain-containing protein [Roseibacterium elongatum]AHM04722.1 hypothetical protein roselon_02395 [Roseibacterium elongatum DSM 19469]